MATTNSQRIGIWIIAIVMAVGTIGSFFAVILANDNDKADQMSLQERRQKYQEEIDKQTAELSKEYYPVFSQYKDRVAPFDKASVTAVTSEDLKVGDGEEVKDGTQYSAYYIGWNPDGKIFDQSIDGESLKAPIPGQGLIEGWTEGVKGMKIGGVRLITMPADKAYGDTGQGDLIPPHTPLKFLVLAIPTPKEIPITGLTN